jgi:uncharacterized protein with NRDE domain
MKKYAPKVVETMYAVLINGSLDTTYDKLSKARKYVKSMRITEEVQEVRIVKQCTSQTTLDVLTPQVKKTLTAAQFDWIGE